MPTITFIQQDRSQQAVTAATGLSVMEAAVQNGVPGILAECGGACACATCQVVVAPDWFTRVGPSTEGEREVMVFAATPPEPTSRLSCQIKLSDALDGLVVTIPDNQS